MRTGAESQTWLQMQHRPALRIIGFLPGGADQKLFPHRDRMKILLPVIDPVLFRTAFHGKFAVNALAGAPLPEESQRLFRVLLRADVKVHQSVFPVLCQQLLVD